MAKKKAETRERVVLSVLVDESGSMQGNENSVIESYNEFIADLAGSDEAKGKDVRATLGMFDTRSPLLRLKYDATPLEEVQPLNRQDYQPAGGTPLNDAMLATIKAVDNAEPDRALVVVITDGYENASEATKEAVAKEVRKREGEGWRFIYMGANQDSWAEGGGRGMAASSSYAFASTPSGIKSTKDTLTRRGTSYLMSNATFDISKDEEFAATGNVIPDENQSTNSTEEDELAAKAEKAREAARTRDSKRNKTSATEAATKAKDLLK